jgi:hypothetical protein
VAENSTLGQQEFNRAFVLMQYFGYLRRNPNDPPANDSPGGQPSKIGSGKQSSHRTLWLKDGAFVRPIEVTAGTSDGANTAVAAEGLQEGQEVVTGETAASTQADVKNPFLPKVIRR